MDAGRSLLSLAVIHSAGSLSLHPRPAWEALSLFILGLFLWTLLHRFVFHGLSLRENKKEDEVISSPRSHSKRMLGLTTELLLRNQVLSRY